MKRPAVRPIQEVAISEFKAKCLALLENVRKTKQPVRVTRRGKPVADVMPAAEGAETSDWRGSMKGLMEITGDVVSPVIDLDDIEAMKE